MKRLKLCRTFLRQGNFILNISSLLDLVSITSRRKITQSMIVENTNTETLRLKIEVVTEKDDCFTIKISLTDFSPRFTMLLGSKHAT